MNKLIKNILFLSLILFNTIIFVAIAQDNAKTSQNDEKQVSTTNPIESLYAQYKEFGKVTVNPESLESTIALLKENITQLELKKPSLQKKSRLYYATGIITALYPALCISLEIIDNIVYCMWILKKTSSCTFPFLITCKNGWLSKGLYTAMQIYTKHGLRKLCTELGCNAWIFGQILNCIATITGIFISYHLFKKASHTFESVQDIANDIALNQAILQQLEKELQRISNEKTN